MTHIIALVDTREDFHKYFLDWLGRRAESYGSDCFMVPREMKIYEISINKKYKDKLITELRYFHHNRINVPTVFLKFIAKVLKGFKPIKDTNKPLDRDFRRKLKEEFGMITKSGKGYWYVYLLGEIPDETDKEGRELL